MNNSKCQSCNKNIAILNCMTCSLIMCYFCDEKLHADKENHITTTLPFASQHPTQSNQSHLNQTIHQKRLELQELKDKEQKMAKIYQEKMLHAQKKYEQQINALEERLQSASQFMNQVQDQVEEIDVDKMQNELEGLDKSLKLDIKKAEQEQAILLEKSKNSDQLISKLQKATEIEHKQILKMNEVLAVFKACSEQLQKEKDLLMLDNEKLVGEVEIFAKFMAENGPLLEEIGKVQNEQQQQQQQQQQ
ncbi:unnamed protein product (macronuclear) [Paramecium tetraurelia]|uniref:B box-type domain-containing protein n=1 Tax=Paramecium tetraurelia TaxID=5888 RepID=A0DRH8_PARTE|nr:uncharacterized protein GSPATT00019362001 [Paramecium tetraurelia]CAK85645.1 unnamed protein product [Paramecium tetraurelia]|eukprot:XP_001453042.1 hypothetical protein (macronuclear) [Paramecium tetraurelia strain d4-2]